VVGRRGEVENFFGREFWGREDPGKRTTDAGKEMIIRETGATGSSSRGALVAANSVQAP
jgi:hypothetical protein